MRTKIVITFILCIVLVFSSLGQTNTDTNQLDYRIHTFYYGWFGNPEYDGKYAHWNHQIIPHWVDTTWDEAGQYPGGDDIGANFYPELGCYSSNDPAVIAHHLRQIRNAGIGVVVLSWWGKDSFSDQSVKACLDMAQKRGLKIAFHIEPIYSTPEEFRGLLQYLYDQYINHPAIYRLKGKPIYYLYNSYRLNYRIWQGLLKEDSVSTIRGTGLDGIFISLWTFRKDGEFALRSGFDGVYTYFASDGFSFGSTTSNWGKMKAYASENNLIFIPCVGPGYIDTRIRPWNEKTTRDRDHGSYYEKMFMNAVQTDPDYIGITSFNEWHEGTQIEPAIPKKIPSFQYDDYGENTDPSYYIYKTRELIDNFEQGENR